jgi:hypothetical protein
MIFYQEILYVINSGTIKYAIIVLNKIKKIGGTLVQKHCFIAEITHCHETGFKLVFHVG